MYPGKLIAYVGPMYSGKSHHMAGHFLPMQLAHNLQFALFQPQKNLRDGAKLSSRTGIALPAQQISSLLDIPIGVYGYIGIDELHLFGAKDIAHLQTLRQAGAEVIVSLLDLDYRAQLMPAFKAVLELGPDQVVHLRAVCSKCHSYNTATYTQILNQSGEVILAGLQSEKSEEHTSTLIYEARCATCFNQSKHALKF